MPVSFEWKNETEGIVQITFYRKWSVDELASIVDRTEEAIAYYGKPIYVIVDGTHSIGVPRANLVPHFKRIFSLDFQYAVLIGGSTVTHLLIRAVIKLNPEVNKRFKLVDTYEEAIALIDTEIQKKHTT